MRYAKESDRCVYPWLYSLYDEKKDENGENMLCGHARSCGIVAFVKKETRKTRCMLIACHAQCLKRKTIQIAPLKNAFAKNASVKYMQEE